MKRAVIAAISTAVFSRLNISSFLGRRRLYGVGGKMAARPRSSISGGRRWLEARAGRRRPAAQQRSGRHPAATGALQLGDRKQALTTRDDERVALDADDR